RRSGPLLDANRQATGLETAHKLWILPGAAVNIFPCEEFVISRWHILEFESAGRITEDERLVHAVAEVVIVDQNNGSSMDRSLIVVDTAPFESTRTRSYHDGERIARLILEAQAIIQDIDIAEPDGLHIKTLKNGRQWRGRHILRSRRRQKRGHEDAI